MKDILAAIGALVVLTAAGVFVLSMVGLRAERRTLQRTRDERAKLPADQVARDMSLWLAFWLDHDLHKIKKPKEWKK